MSYVLEDYKFGTGGYGTGATVTWSFATSNFAQPNEGFQPFSYNSFLTGQFQTEVRAALAAWEAVANIDFVEVADSTNSTLRFGFVDNFPALWGGAAEAGAPGGRAGQANVFYDNSAIHHVTDADIAFDARENWQVVNGEMLTGPNGTRFFSIALHEIGHVLGLDHDDNGTERSIMQPSLDPSYRGLEAVDIQGAQFIYGAAVAQPVAGSVAISDVTIAEGNAGTKVATFTVTRSGGTAAFNVNFATSNGTATTADNDYVGNSGTLNFGANVNSKTLSVVINGDTKIEGNETFNVLLSAATNGATISDNVGIGTINNDDAANTPPVATINDHTVNANEWAQIKNWLSYSDANGNAATKYEFWDGGTAGNSGYFWTPGNAHHAAGTAIEVAASDVASVWVRGGQAGGSETMWVRAFDGTDWSTWDAFNFTTLANTPPVATINDHTVNANEWAQVKNWLSYSDANGNAATKYEFWDGGTAGNSGYFWTPGNAHHAAGTAIEVAASDVASVWVRGGQAGGSETMWVRAFDGTDWSTWDAFNFTTLANTPPVATIDDHTLQTNQWAQVRNWVSYSDANGNAATKYEFWDGGTEGNSGYFWTPNNAHHGAGTAIEVAAADIANVWVRGGEVRGTETMWVRAFDGTDWSTWDAFNVMTVL